MQFFVKESYSWDKMFDHSVFLYSIHNIGYQGRFSKETLAKTELNPEHIKFGGALEFEDSFSMMKGGILNSEVISTVSKTYAHEILTPEYGAGLQEILRSRQSDFFGVLNGILKPTNLFHFISQKTISQTRKRTNNSCSEKPH